ncbi:DUF1287 domain-containing protein [Massilia sp. GCM10020059]|uniref:DUF1287 domain-containing protein n=1 Tax=Massilia agrisoli TaxID=2892444 RepID=A0ABS8IPQ9_9BURK|nr:DUF1287 domain-containing protein [Massilia agrisoli]MCC6070365.1 DUF1287 domain-containing protein [Massilia agrisoli]
MRTLSLTLSFLLLAPIAYATPGEQLVAAARQQIGVTIRYDGRYQRLAYPGGDVPMETGVCTDVVIRAYRRLGIDLQEKVHRDMGAAWAEYPHPLKWGLKARDENIDHRRVLNLATFFRRHGTSLEPSQKPQDYIPGDIVAWLLPGALPHIGIVSNTRSGRGTPLIIHNIGAGAEESDVLFAYKITGHYRYAATPFPAGQKRGARASLQ